MAQLIGWGFNDVSRGKRGNGFKFESALVATSGESALNLFITDFLSSFVDLRCPAESLAKGGPEHGDR